VRDTLAWLTDHGDALREEWGIAPEREAELLAQWHSGS
jgi:hypothetical protein